MRDEAVSLANGVWPSAARRMVRAGLWYFEVVYRGEVVRVGYAAAMLPGRAASGRGRWWLVSVENEDGGLERRWCPTLGAAKWWAVRRWADLQVAAGGCDNGEPCDNPAGPTPCACTCDGCAAARCVWWRRQVEAGRA